VRDEENMHHLSQDIEHIIEKAEFCFMETVISGDPLDGTGELRKILGLTWDTENDGICIDVKINYGEKKKGAYIQRRSLSG
jgi:hypothetical protein